MRGRIRSSPRATTTADRPTRTAFRDGQRHPAAGRLAFMDLEEHVGAGVGMTLTVGVVDEALVFRSQCDFVDCLGCRLHRPERLTPGALTVTHADAGGRATAGAVRFIRDIVHPWVGPLIRQEAVVQDAEPAAPRAPCWSSAAMAGSVPACGAAQVEDGAFRSGFVSSVGLRSSGPGTTGTVHYATCWKLSGPAIGALAACCLRGRFPERRRSST
ncbi:DUF4166 domain-containing protein [Methylobacterium symbioticum]